MPTLYFTPPATFAPGPAFGIGIQDPPGDPNHQISAINALNSLNALGAGNNLLTAICNQIVATAGAVRVGITPWGPNATNECATIGNQDNAKTTLALALEFQHAGAAAALTAALVAAGQAPPGGYGWLANQICNHYIPDIQQLPAGAASHTVHGANWVTGAMVQGWATGAAVFPAPLAGQQAIDAHLIVVCVLHGNMAAGPGVSATVRWNTQSQSFTDTAGVVHARPPLLALAHELVHAYHNITGTQSGHDTGTPSRALYEWLCIGIGDWAAEPISENSVRAAMGGVLPRQRY